MRKLCTVIIGIFFTLFFTACKQYTAHIEEYLSYWSSQAYVTAHTVRAVQHTDEMHILSVPSAEDVKIDLTLYNPKNFPLVMPTSPADAGKIIRFSGLEPQPEYGTDYTLEKTASDTMQLVYKSAFLQKYEWGRSNIGPEIALSSTDKRVFNQTYTFKLKANTPPPQPACIVAKTAGTPAQYVLCITVPETDMQKTVAGGLLHKDIKHININGTSYPFSVNAAQIAFTQPESDNFIVQSEVVQLSVSSADKIPTSGWVLYYKTDVAVQDGAAKKDYTITLADEQGLVSEELKASTKPNRPAPVTITLAKGTCQEDVNSDNAQTTPHTIQIAGGGTNATLRLTCATADSIIHYTVTETTGGSSGSSSTGSGASRLDIPLPILTGKTEAEYTLTVWANAAGFETGAKRTLYYKITAQKSSAFYVRGTNGDWYNSVQGAAEGNDTTGTGSQEKPYQTVSKALTQCAKTGTAYTIFVDGTIDENTALSIASDKAITIQSLRSNTPATIHDARNTAAGSSPSYIVTTQGTLILDSVIIKANVTATQGIGANMNAGGIEQDGGTVTVKGDTTEIKNFAYAVMIKSGTFTMEAGSICNNYVNGNTSGVTIGSGGTFILNGGSIKDNEASNGAGVSVAGSSLTAQGTFSMAGGEISGNKALCFGGGIYVGQYGTAAISGGTIKANTAAQGASGSPAEDVGGGGIYIEKGTVHFTGGIIEGNIIHEVEKNCGAGVFIGESGTFTMSGGAIKDCTTTTSASEPSRGIGVYVAGGAAGTQGTFNMTGGTIQNCMSGTALAADGGGVYVGAGAVFTMGGSATVTPSTDSDKGKQGKNDVYLDTGSKITLDESLSPQGGAAAARITVPAANYAPTTQTLTGTGVSTNYTKFTVTPKGTDTWKVSSVGKLFLHTTTIDGSTASTDAWKKLKDAVAAVADGGTIIINGEIKATNHTDNSGEIVINKNLTIKKADAATTAVINANCNYAGTPPTDAPLTKHRIFKVTNQKRLTLENLTLKGGFSSEEGGGIYTDSYAQSLLSNCTIESCKARDGGAITAKGGSSINLTNCIVKGNSADYNGGAIAALADGSTGSTLIITGGTIGGDSAMEANKAIFDTNSSMGGGIYVGTNGTLTIKNAHVIGNTSMAKGGGIYFTGSTFTLENSTISNNSAKEGGGVYIIYGTKVTMTASTINNCQASENGGAIYISAWEVELKGCTLTGNSANKGGGIYTHTDSNRTSKIIITGGTIGGDSATEANKATGSDSKGGGIYLDKENTLILQNYRANNTEQGAKIIGNTATSGGGVYVEDYTAGFIMNGSATVTPSTDSDKDKLGKNDVYLGGGSKIKLADDFSPQAPAGRITPDNYSVGRTVIHGSADAMRQYHTMFTVTPQTSPTQKWQIDDTGMLRKEQ